MVGGLIVASERWHGAFTGDSDMKKPQASHSRPTPRVGGLAVLAGTLAGLLVLGPSNMTLDLAMARPIHCSNAGIRGGPAGRHHERCRLR